MPTVGCESFPRMWDQPVHCIDSFTTQRIIPTYVGSTLTRAFDNVVFSNHSHVCGINPIDPEPVLPDVESFPRLWDQRRSAARLDVYARIIPTYVGSTRKAGAHGIYIANHSHVCGINGCKCFNRYKRVESFPRMWDQLFH